MKKLEILQKIRLRDKMIIIYILGGMIPFIISSYYANIQGRNTMTRLVKESQMEELSIMKDRIRESMDVVEKVFYKIIYK